MFNIFLLITITYLNLFIFCIVDSFNVRHPPTSIKYLLYLKWTPFMTNPITPIATIIYIYIYIYLYMYNNNSDT